MAFFYGWELTLEEVEEKLIPFLNPKKLGFTSFDSSWEKPATCSEDTLESRMVHLFSTLKKHLNFEHIENDFYWDFYTEDNLVVFGIYIVNSETLAEFNEDLELNEIAFKKIERFLGIPKFRVYDND